MAWSVPSATQEWLENKGERLCANIYNTTNGAEQKHSVVVTNGVV